MGWERFSCCICTGGCRGLGGDEVFGVIVISLYGLELTAPRFVASEEAGCSRAHKEAVVSAGWNDTTRTLVVSGRPLRVRRNEYIADWERKEDEVKELTEKGVVPMERDIEEDREFDMPFLMGQVCAVVNDIKPAKQIIEDMVREAVEIMRVGQGYVGGKDSKL